MGRRDRIPVSFLSWFATPRNIMAPRVLCAEPTPIPSTGGTSTDARQGISTKRMTGCPQLALFHHGNPRPL